jgi:hypothetical protein
MGEYLNDFVCLKWTRQRFSIMILDKEILRDCPQSWDVSLRRFGLGKV